MHGKLLKPFVMLVEGNDEQFFFEGLLSHMALSNVEVIGVGGKDKFPAEFGAFVIAPGFADVQAYAIVRDADSDAAAALRSVQGLLKKHNQPVPPASGQYDGGGKRRVGLFIMPGNAESGMLEDLCLQTVADDPAMPCVDAAFTCIKKVLRMAPEVEPEDLSVPYLPKNLSKSRALLFLATRRKPMASVGWAAHNKVWKLDHPCMDTIKRFVSELAK